MSINKVKNMATIKIKRKSHLMNMARNYKIFIDGEFVGKISNGATAEFPVTAGKHTVTAKIDWCSSPTVSVEVGTDETKRLTVGGFKYNWLIFLWIAGVVLLSFVRIVDFHYPTLLLLPPFLLATYYTTFGRKKYLTLKEAKH